MQKCTRTHAHTTHMQTSSKLMVRAACVAFTASSDFPKHLRELDISTNPTSRCIHWHMWMAWRWHSTAWRRLLTMCQYRLAKLKRTHDRPRCKGRKWGRGRDGRRRRRNVGRGNMWVRVNKVLSTHTNTHTHTQVGPSFSDHTCSTTSLKTSTFEFWLNNGNLPLSFFSFRYFQRLVLHSSIKRAGWSSGSWFAGLPYHSPWTRQHLGDVEQWRLAVTPSQCPFEPSHCWTLWWHILSLVLSLVHSSKGTYSNHLLLSRVTFDPSITNRGCSPVDSRGFCWDMPEP